MQTLNFGYVQGLTQEEQKQLRDLADAYNYHQSRNAAKDKYYEGHITLNDVNLGIALPQGLRNLEVGCSWGQTYMGALIAATSNPETGENPEFGQLAQGSLTPHVEKMRMTATQFAAATGLTVTDVGVVNDANPTSSDAILAQSQTLVLLAQQLNTGNGDALRTIACMAQAVARDCALSDLTEEETGIMAHFKNPAMPSVAVTADAAIKIASARQEFAGTDTFLEMIGFDQADIRRIKAQEQRQRGQKLLMEMEDADLSENVE